jgi:centrosomal protein CEP290
VGKEVDRALGRQAEEVQRLTRRVTFLEGHLEKERAHIAVLEDKGATLEAQLEDALARNAQYESGVYGLPQVGEGLRDRRGVPRGGGWELTWG